MRILYIIPVIVEGGGVEKILYDWVSRFDKKMLAVDILAGKIVSEKKKAEFEQLGCSVYEFGCSMWRIDRRVKILRKILAHGYDIVHIHSASSVDAWMLREAKKAGIDVRIIHSHNAVETGKLTTRFAFFVTKPFLRKYATHFWGCSEKSIYTLCGMAESVRKNHRVIKNGIQIERYLYNALAREKIRNNFNLGARFVIGNVGRLCTQKNQIFLLEVFAEVLKTEKNAVLMLVGDGDMKSVLQKKAAALGVEKNIIFTGNVSNVEELYQAMDCYVMTSIYEGLVIAGIEAQCAGLPCIFSSSITQEVKITDNAEFISLDENPFCWAERIFTFKNFVRRDMSGAIKAAGYEINAVSADLQNLYLNMEK